MLSVNKKTDRFIKWTVANLTSVVFSSTFILLKKGIVGSFFLPLLYSRKNPMWTPESSAFKFFLDSEKVGDELIVWWYTW